MSQLDTPGRVPALLVPVQIAPAPPDLDELLAWPYDDPFVSRILAIDIPQRSRYGNCRLWRYHDSSGAGVGFGTLDVCDDWGRFTGGQSHPYVPLLAVSRVFQRRGYGAAILRHLVEEAALLAAQPGGCYGSLFLDVYTSSVGAIRLYEANDFTAVAADPLHDPDEDGKPYLVMARRLTAVPTNPR